MSLHQSEGLEKRLRLLEKGNLSLNCLCMGASTSKVLESFGQLTCPEDFRCSSFYTHGSQDLKVNFLLSLNIYTHVTYWFSFEEVQLL